MRDNVGKLAEIEYDSIDEMWKNLSSLLHRFLLDLDFSPGEDGLTDV